jgi:hypothetical protein
MERAAEAVEDDRAWLPHCAAVEAGREAIVPQKLNVAARDLLPDQRSRVRLLSRQGIVE